MLEHITILVAEYDPAIAFFVDVLGFTLVEDSPATSSSGESKRWVVVRPQGAQTGIVLARAQGSAECAAIGNQLAGRVGFFLRVENFDAQHQRMFDAGVTFISAPRAEPYGPWARRRVRAASASRDACVLPHKRVVALLPLQARDMRRLLRGERVPELKKPPLSRRLLRVSRRSV